MVSHSHPSIGRRSVSKVVAIVLLVATFLVLVHWHRDSEGQRCEICFARQLPSIYVPFIAWLALPTRVEWRFSIEKPLAVQAAFFHFVASRAPPPAFSL
jgi:hypothetical protein